LAIITLALIAALLAGVGLVTAAVALRASDEQVDRALKAAADTRLAQLEQQAATAPTASPSETPEPTESDETPEPPETDDGGEGDGSGSDNSGSGSDNSGAGSGNSGPDDETPRPAPTRQPTPTETPVVTPTPQPTPTSAPTLSLGGTGSAPLENADTFFLLVTPTGNAVSNPQDISLIDLPDRTAVGNALVTGEDDWRTVSSNGVPVRLLTQRVDDGRGGAPAVLQSGFVLLFQDQQRNQLLATILLASLAGLAGAALVTLLVTRRALQPVRTAFAAERRFVAAASHELRTPVAVVRSSAEILQREDLVTSDGKALVEDIIAESDRLGRLVSDMLALASAEAGQMTVDPTEIEMRDFVQQIARRAEAMAVERGVSLEVIQDAEGQPGDRELMVSADPDRMTQLLMIFIDNAIDHSPHGGTVRLFVRPVMAGGHQQVAVGVADEGPGVPREERARIFEPFARLRGRRRETGNTGLGLAIARILAARQQGSLHVDDAAGGGAVFSVWLPRLLPR
jgi:signal transduction histidine kinase